MAVDPPESEQTPSPEGEQGVRILELDQEFELFQDQSRGNHWEIIKLRITDLLTIPFNVGHADSSSLKKTLVTPFHPDNGYRVDVRDYDLEKRLVKVQEDMGMSDRIPKKTLSVLVLITWILN
jgi:hypothetical protein